MALVVNLIGPPPWGFRVQGGRDFRGPLTISKVNRVSKAEVAKLQVGDVITEINGERTAAMLNVEAQDKIRTSRSQLRLLIDRRSTLPRYKQNYGVRLCEQRVLHQDLQTYKDQRQIQRRSVVPIAALPLPSPPQPPLKPNNLPIKTKSQESDFAPVERIQNQAQTKAGALVRAAPSSPQGSKKRVTFDTPIWRYAPIDSEGLWRLQQSRAEPSTPKQSQTFRLLQQGLEAERTGRPSSAVGARRSPSWAGVPKFRTCERCGNFIVTQVVRVREGRHRHLECYTCKDCGLSLLSRGHFWVDEELYCGRHARQRYQAESSLSKPQFASKQR